MNNKTIPYTYRISQTKLDCHYYGVRFAKNCSPSEFQKTYFTSSSQVRKFVELYGDPDVKEIRRTFVNKQDALNQETKTLKRLKVKSSSKQLNISENDGYMGSSNKTGRPKGLTTVKDLATGEIKCVHKNDPKIKTGEYVHPTKGTKTVYDTVSKRNCRIPVSNIDSRYIPINKGFLVVQDIETLQFVRIVRKDYDKTKYSIAKKDKSYTKTEEFKKKMSLQSSGTNNPMYGRTGNLNPFYGKHHKPESIAKQKESMKAKRASGWKPDTSNNPATRGKKQFTDGLTSILIDPSKIPEGFYPGRIRSKRKS